MEIPLSNLMLSTDRGGTQPSEALFGALYRELRGVARREVALGAGGQAPNRVLADSSVGATQVPFELQEDPPVVRVRVDAGTDQSRRG